LTGLRERPAILEGLDLDLYDLEVLGVVAFDELAFFRRRLLWGRVWIS
jgi:hypothetical protein